MLAGTFHLVTAGPGAGKTQSVVDTAAECLRTGAPPSTILVLTLHRGMVDDLTARLCAQVPEDRRGALPRIDTPVGLATEILRQAGRAGRRRAMGELEEHIVLGRVIDEVVGTGDPYATPAIKASDGFVADVAALIAQLKQCKVDPDAFARLSRGVLHEPELQVLGRVYAAYARRLTEAGTIDYRGVMWLALEALGTEPELLARHCAQWRHILVDEAEELTPLAWELLLTIGAEADIRAWGDPAQSIYGFRGAVSNPVPLITHLAPAGFRVEEHPGYSAPSHRVGRRVAEISARFRGPSARRFAPCDMDGSTRFALFASIEEELDWVTDQVLNLLEAEPPTAPDRIAIITRSRAWAARALERLHRAGAPISATAGGPGAELMKRFIADGLTLLMRRRVAHVRGGRQGVRDANRALAHLLSYLALPDPLPFAIELARAMHDAEREGKLVDRVGSRHDSVARQECLARVSQFLTDAIDRLAGDPIGGVEALVVHLRPARRYVPEVEHEAMQTAGRFLRAARRTRATLENLFGAEATPEELAEWLDDLLADDGGGPAEGGVAVIPVHDAKGREFDHVFVPMVNDGIFPSGGRTSRLLAQDTLAALRIRVADASGLGEAFTRLPGFLEAPGEAVEEEERAFDVALTRASQSVILSAHLQRAGQIAIPSRFFVRCLPPDALAASRTTEGCPLGLHAVGMDVGAATAVGCAQCVLDPCPRRQREQRLGEPVAPGEPIRPDTDGPAVLAGFGSFALSASSVGEYLQCPRRFFLGRLLRLDDRVSPASTYGIIMHRVLAEMARWLPEERTLDKALEVAQQRLNADRNSFGSPAEFELARRNAEAALTTYFGAEDHRVLDPTVVSEQTVEFSLCDSEGSEHRFLGRVDLVADGSEGREVVDYKTGASPPSPKVLRKRLVLSAEGEPDKYADFQLVLYALAPLLAGEAKALSLQYITPDYRAGCPRITVRIGDASDEADVSSDHLVEVGRFLGDTACEIKTTVHFAAEPETCRGCPFAGICDGEGEAE